MYTYTCTYIYIYKGTTTSFCDRKSFRSSSEIDHLKPREKFLKRATKGPICDNTRIPLCGDERIDVLTYQAAWNVNTSIHSTYFKSV